MDVVGGKWGGEFGERGLGIWGNGDGEFGGTAFPYFLAPIWGAVLPYIGQRLCLGEIWGRGREFGELCSRI